MEGNQMVSFNSSIFLVLPILASCDGGGISSKSYSAKKTSRPILRFTASVAGRSAASSRVGLLEGNQMVSLNSSIPSIFRATQPRQL